MNRNKTSANIYDENFMEYNDENFYQQDDYWNVNHDSTWELTPTSSFNFKKVKMIIYNYQLVNVACWQYR